MVFGSIFLAAASMALRLVSLAAGDDISEGRILAFWAKAASPDAKVSNPRKNNFVMCSCFVIYNLRNSGLISGLRRLVLLMFSTINNIVTTFAGFPPLISVLTALIRHID